MSAKPSKFPTDFMSWIPVWSNVTWVIGDTTGGRDPVTGEYTGCVLSLDRNESDVGMVIVPFDYYGPRIQLDNFVMSDNPVIGSVYSTTYKLEKSAHVLDFLSGYTTGSWVCTVIMTLATCILLGLTIKVRSCRPRRRQRTFANVWRTCHSVLLSCALKQHSGCHSLLKRSFGARFVYLLLNVLALFSALFLTSMIKTQMIVEQRPPTFDSYQDLIDQNITPLWISSINDQTPFSNARPGSKERQIWDQAVERGIDRSLLSLKMNDWDVMRYLEPFLDLIKQRKAASLSNRRTTEAGQSNACAGLYTYNKNVNVSAYSKADPDAKQYLRALPVSSRISPTRRKAIRKAILCAVEGGALQALQGSFKFYAFSNEGHVSEVEECMSNQVRLPEHGHTPVPLPHYYDLLRVDLCCLLLAFLILWLESCVKGKKKENRQREEVAPAPRLPLATNSLGQVYWIPPAYTTRADWLRHQARRRQIAEAAASGQSDRQ